MERWTEKQRGLARKLERQRDKHRKAREREREGNPVEGDSKCQVEKKSNKKSN